jgi:Putative Ig domain
MVPREEPQVTTGGKRSFRSTSETLLYFTSFSVLFIALLNAGCAGLVGGKSSTTPPSPSQLAIATGSLPQALTGQPYAATVQATGGTPSYTWTVTSGQLPAGLSLGAASGRISGTPSASGQVSLTVQVSDSAPQPRTASQSLALTVASAPLTDQYGGLLTKPSPSGATGFFRTEKFGSRWMLVSPAGNAYWLLGVAVVSSTTPGLDPSGKTYWNYASAKYGNSSTWASQEKKRLLGWGFNALSWGVNSAATSFSTQGQPAAQPLMPHFNEHISFALHSMQNLQGHLTSPVKNILSPFNISAFPDVYDPGFTSFAFWAMATNIHGTIGFPDAEYKSPWVIGYFTDESDELKGFGNRQTHPHLGWIVSAMPPAMTTGQVLFKPVTYSDSTVYSKLALVTFLQGRYSTIAALNAAWGANYTTWGSAGGYGTGTGLLDENGNHSWMGDQRSLAGETAAMQKDLDDFLFQIAQKYFQVCHDAIRAVDTNHLIIGPIAIGGPDTRPQVLLAAVPYLDVFFVNPLHLTDTVNPVADTYNVTGKPFLSGSKVFLAEPDSPLAANPTTSPCCNASLTNTQAERGQAYANYLQTLVQLKGSDGVYPVMGSSWWSLADFFSEKANYGLVTTRDNAYNGQEGIIQLGLDPWGYSAGGELANYGDSISAIQSANLATLKTVSGP